MKVSWDDYSQLNVKMKFMFQTTNQLLLAFFLFDAMVVYLYLIDIQELSSIYTWIFYYKPSIDYYCFNHINYGIHGI